jgi:hypothetical protein
VAQLEEQGQDAHQNCADNAVQGTGRDHCQRSNDRQDAVAAFHAEDMA